MRPVLLQLLHDAGLRSFRWIVPTPGAVYAFLFLVLVLVFLRRARRAGQTSTTALEVLLAGAVGAAIGTRAFFLLASGGLWSLPPARWFSPSLGTASWGAYLGAILGIACYCRFARLATLPLLDIGASCAGLGDAIGRWSCLLAGDDFGTITSVPWAISFPAGSLAHDAHVAVGLLPAASPASLPVHPFQLYLVANGLLVFALTTWIWHRYRSLPGVTLAAFALSYGSSRFWWEFFRAPDAGATGLLSASQQMCLLLALGGLALGAMLAHRERRDRPAGAAPGSE